MMMSPEENSDSVKTVSKWQRTLWRQWKTIMHSITMNNDQNEIKHNDNTLYNKNSIIKHR